METRRGKGASNTGCTNIRRRAKDATLLLSKVDIPSEACQNALEREDEDGKNNAWHPTTDTRG